MLPILNVSALIGGAGPRPVFARTDLLTTVRNYNEALSSRGRGRTVRSSNLNAPTAHTKVVRLLVTERCIREGKQSLVPAPGKLRMCSVMGRGVVTGIDVAKK